MFLGVILSKDKFAGLELHLLFEEATHFVSIDHFFFFDYLSAHIYLLIFFVSLQNIISPCDIDMRIWVDLSALLLCQFKFRHAKLCALRSSSHVNQNRSDGDL